MSAPAKSYLSFLICFHEDHAAAYISGLPLAVVKSGGAVELAKVNPLSLPSVTCGKAQDLATIRELVNVVLIRIQAHVNQPPATN